MPYIFAAAVEASRAGTPVMRAMMLEFPGDEACAYLDRQYMLGPALLVAPVFDDEGDVSYYLPDGRWTRLLPAAAASPNRRLRRKRRPLEGGRWIREKHGYLSMPLLARPSHHPLGAVDDLPDYDYAEGASFHVFEPSRARRPSASVTDLEGRAVLTCRAQLRGKRLSVKIEGGKGRYRVHVRMARAAIKDELERGFDLVAGGAIEIDVDGE